ncbi:MAG: D-hexose-6-phosphate mutarotase [Microbacteriaceae bacterium]|nr:D-hexose-6-phosphate mutarotase [Microbacteriaceae bacterium]
MSETDDFRILDRGAHVTHWRPAGAAHPVLWSSAIAESSAERAWRGGVPICAPWFAAGPDGRRSPSHGPARTAVWEALVPDGDDAGEGLTRHRLEVRGDAAGAPARLELELTTRRGADSLETALELRNAGDGPALVEAALHSYFAVSDVTAIALEGLERAPFFDKVSGLVRAPGEAPPFGELVDRVHESRRGDVVIADAGWSRRLRIEREGAAEIVVWNPGPDHEPGDVEPGDWRGFVCVEAAVLGAGAVTLAPGAGHRLVSRVRVEPMPAGDAGDEA